MKEILMVCLLNLAIAGCATTEVKHSSDIPENKNPGCTVEFFMQQEPEGDYQVLNELETHTKRNLFFGGKVNLTDDVYTRLRKESCAMGGNGVIITDYIESQAGEMTHVHTWAKVIKRLE
ncbi:hypothetical protein OLMES_0508 [Oleiphilus messinensis]|uniref:Lipoprotein n=1 Tax=Oleiphilus messinensis TaxID=141451 RepID=A0A1Y0I2I2_9GAMM|nr:hypothetical protein [Oleiphilus messinensis]ARU54611.1 hypothetical protein OLMES_0508 [Oleiphilus messinensis]